MFISYIDCDCFCTIIIFIAIAKQFLIFIKPTQRVSGLIVNGRLLSIHQRNRLFYIILSYIYRYIRWVCDTSVDNYQSWQLRVSLVCVDDNRL